MSLDLGMIGRFLRRKYYLHFRPLYVIRQLRLRKGSCKRCSCCESNAFLCGKLDIRTKECLVFPDCIYGEYASNVYPFDEKDKHPRYKDKCGFYWD